MTANEGELDEIRRELDLLVVLRGRGWWSSARQYEYDALACREARLLESA
jgi:hypothetical protein